MNLLLEPQISPPSACAYIDGEQWRFEYFFAHGLSAEELNQLLANGWRKFGLYYFRPACEGCTQCVPIRVRVSDFSLSRSQRRVLKRGRDISVLFKPLTYDERIYKIYEKHSLEKFGKVTDRDEYIESFYTESCPSIQSEYYCEGQLIAAGFLDVSDEALSSIYFVYDTDFAQYSPGTLGAIREIEYAKSIGLDYYYLGYYIEENRSMSYKNSFHPNEKFDWAERVWKPGE